MASVADLIVRIRTQGDNAAKDIDKTANAADKWSGRAKKAGAALAIASGAIIAFGTSAVKSASRTEQAMGGIDAVFGKNAGTVKKWAAGAATSVGLAKSQYGEFAAVIGSQLKGMGLPLDQVTGKTNDLIKMGADLAATYGGTTADAVEALSAALKGETDPIEKYGVSIKAADVAAQKAADGASGLTGAADKQATAMATLGLITASTADANGQFAKQSGQAAGQAQIAGAQFENMKSALGTVLLPVVAMAAGLLGNLAKVIGEHAKTAQIFAGAILAMAAVMLVLVAAVKVYNTVTAITAIINLVTWGWMAVAIIAVVAAVVLLVAAIVILWKKSASFRGFVIGVWNSIKAAAVTVAAATRAAWAATWAALSAAGRAIANAFRSAFAAIRAVSSAVAGAVRGAWASVVGTVTNIAARIRSAFTTAFDAVRRAASGVASAVAAPFHAIQSAINGVIGAIQSLIGWLGRIKVPKISLPKIPGVGRSVPSAATPTGGAALGAAPSVAMPAARSTSSGGAAVVINITGAIDPESTARQIRRILSGSDVRHSRSRGMRTA